MRIKQNIVLILLLIISKLTIATHNRAGEITYTQISDLTYEITITTYTYVLSNVERTELEVEWGDGIFTNVPNF